MHISLTPELENKVRTKVDSGMYNNASEVVREALRFMDENKELVELLKLKALREELYVGEEQAKQGMFVADSFDDIIAEAKAENGL